MGYDAPAAYQVPVPAELVFHPAKTKLVFVRDPLFVAKFPPAAVIVCAAGADPVVGVFPL